MLCCFYKWCLSLRLFQRELVKLLDYEIIVILLKHFHISHKINCLELPYINIIYEPPFR